MALTRPTAAQINFDVTNITDPLITLNSGESGSADKDVGIVIERGSDTNVAIIYDESADTFAVINTSEDGTTSGNVSISSYAPVKLSNLIIADAGNIGSASDTDAIAISSGGVVTMNQIPVFSAGINVSGGTIAGTLATAAQGNVTSLGTLTTLTVDNIIINGTNIGHTSDTDAIAIASNGVVTFSQTPVFSSDITLTDDLYLDSDGSVIHFGDDGEVTLTHVHNQGLRMEDSDKLTFGAGDDMQLYHDGSNSYIDDGGTGSIFIRSGTTYIQNAAGSKTSIATNAGAGQDIYHNNTVKLTTTANGITVSGGIIIADAGNIGSASDTDAMAIASGGAVTFSQRDVHSAGITIADAGQIGSASDADAIAIASNGVVTFTQAPVFPDGSIAIADLDIDGGTDIGEALADADLLIVDNGAGGTNRKVAMSRVKTYVGGGALDDISAGDSASTLATTAGNITIDAQEGDTDIIFKGTDSSSDITALTLDMSEAGLAIFNSGIRLADGATIGVASSTSAITVASTGIVTFVDDILIKDGGTIGSASDADAIAISSGGVVTMNQIPVFSAGINVSGGTIAGTLATAAQGNVTSLGTLTTLTVDNIIINGTTIGHTSDTDAISISSGGDVTLTQNLILNAQGDIRFADSDSSHYVAFQAPNTIASNITWTLPAADGDEDQVLSTNGSGTLAWADGGGGGGSSGSSYPNSTITTAPASAGNHDLAKVQAQTGSIETPFEAGATDAFGINLGTVYDMSDPAGSTTTVDLGSVA